MEKLLFYSTNKSAPLVDLREALLQGQAPDKGLYMPAKIPSLTLDEINDFANQSYAEIAFNVIKQFTHGVLDNSSLMEICNNAYNFEVPIEHVTNAFYVLRLDRGPTASFKDFAARLMARLLGRFVKETGRHITILTATSGDTGSAVASAFYGVPDIRVLVLFPEKEVSVRQRKQMTTLGGNVQTIAINGKFDDCQRMVKMAFADPALKHIPLSSANSINIGRLLPQSVYYFYAASRINQRESVIFSIPSGNFGNMMGAVLAKKMGLPIHKLIVAVNENNEFPVFLETGTYKKIEPSKNCISNAMNVGHPSNLARLFDIYGGHLDETGIVHKTPDTTAMRRDIFSTSISDESTRETMIQAWKEYKLLLEPHGAVAWKGLIEFTKLFPTDHKNAIVLETAHPAKFPEEIERLLKFSPEPPPAIAELDSKQENYLRMPANYENLKEYLIENYD